MNILGKAKELQSKMQEAQEGLANITATSEAGAGLVKATVNGKKKLLSLEIDPDLLKIEEKEMLQDLIVAATNKALTEVEEKAAAHIQKLTGNLMPDLGNMDFSKFGL
ncbi:MAG: YbaB/EbfC family nucleoid-associated protein [Thermonemataceae bacterium]|nr:YbaB/EbfC family nucleoid-associated protein [Thermonemataceae bacterium]